MKRALWGRKGRSGGGRWGRESNKERLLEV